MLMDISGRVEDEVGFIGKNGNCAAHRKLYTALTLVSYLESKFEPEAVYISFYWSFSFLYNSTRSKTTTTVEEMFLCPLSTLFV